MNVTFDSDELRPLIQIIVAEMLQAIRESESTLKTGRLAYTEPEAAATLGIKPYQLRDARLRGEIVATKVGGRIGYTHQDLWEYLQLQRRLTGGSR